jgi:hypothetical protein
MMLVDVMQHNDASGKTSSRVDVMSGNVRKLPARVIGNKNNNFFNA